ncbi:MAG TPA: DUF302 domain-containing protein [Acidisarcina sp.]
MTVSNISIERFSVVSARPFAEVVAAIESQVGHPVPGEMFKAIIAAGNFSEMESAVQGFVGPTGLMEFMRFDMGMVLSKGEPGKRNVLRLLIGNPLTMRKMAQHVADVGSYVPISVLVDERADGVHVSYDRVASAIAGYGSAAASAVAVELDRKVESLILAAAG